MKALEILLTDTHLTRNTLEDNISIFKQAIIKAKGLKLKRVLHLGDIFTNRTGQTLDILITFYKIIKMFEEEKIQLVSIPGNHDKVYLNSDNSYLDIFKGEYFKVINQPTVEKSGDFIFCFVPYYKEVDLYPEQLKKVKTLASSFDKKLKKILFTHIAVSGVENNDGSVVENNLGKKIFDFFFKVFVGHYHNRSKVGDNIYYIGSGFPQNFGEDNDKGFCIFYDNGEHEYFEPEFKKFIKVEMSVEDFDKSLSSIDKYKGEIDKGNNVRFVLTGDDIKLKSFDNSKITSLGFSIQKKGDKVQENIEEAESQDFVSFSMSSIISSYSDFCEKDNHNSELGLKYLKELENVSE